MRSSRPPAWPGAVLLSGGAFAIGAAIVIFVFARGNGLVAQIVLCAGVTGALVAIVVVGKVGVLPWRGEISKEQYERLGTWNGRWL